jgi:glucans biosynthesis protein
MTDDPMHQCTEVQSAEPHALHQARRCGAKTRSGRPCRSPAVHGRPRCRMHGCAPGAGGPEGERNGNYRHGRHTKESLAKKQEFRNLVREVRNLTRTLRSVTRSAKRSNPTGR